MLALGLKAPFMRVSTAEAAMLAEGVRDVSEQFDVPINAKLLAVMNLFGAACAVYLPRAVVLWATAAMKKARPPMQTADTAPAAQTGNAAGVAVVSKEAKPDSPGTLKFD